MEETHYEMLWDCEYCGMEKLLGVSQRYCPGCGSAQNPSTRYFPEDSDKVAVAEHKYMGADRQCSACDAPNAAIAKHCINCGNNMDGETEVKRMEEEPPKPPPVEKTKKSSSLPMIFLGIAILIGLIFCIGGSCTTAASLAVQGHTWNKSLDVQEYARVQEKSWKDSLPMGAEEVSCREKKRSTKKIPDGEDCKTVKKDKGDGSFVEKEVCTKRYKEIPVMDQYCSFRIEKWKSVTPLTSSGNDLNPSAPKGTVKECSIRRLGCQKKGTLTQTYTVQFTDTTDASSVYSCDFAENIWSSYTVGAQYDGEVRLLGSLDCDSLKEKK